VPRKLARAANRFFHLGLKLSCKLRLANGGGDSLLFSPKSPGPRNSTTERQASSGADRTHLARQYLLICVASRQNCGGKVGSGKRLQVTPEGGQYACLHVNVGVS